MFGDIGKIMKLAGQMKTKLPELQAKLAQTLYTADAGGGAVSAVVNGKFQLVDLKLGKDLLADCDSEMLEDMIKAAVASAQQQAAAAAAAAMKEFTGGMNVPGLEGLM